MHKRGFAILVILSLELVSLASSQLLNSPFSPCFASNSELQSDYWTTKNPAPASGAFESAVIGGKIYIFRISSTYEYDPATDSWTTKHPIPTPRSSFAVAACGDKIYVIGGLSPLTDSSLNVNEVYNPATDTWETKSPMPTNRSQIEANTVGNKIYVTGGRTAGPYSTVGYTEVYDVETNSWSSKASMLYPVALSVSTVLDGKIYIIGGQDEYAKDMNLKVVQIYNPNSNYWSFGASAPAVIWQACAAATTGEFAPKRIYVMGGMEGFAMPLSSNYAYDPHTNSWSSATALPTARYNPTASAVNDKLYVIGGGIGFPYVTAANEEYTPVGYGSPLPPELRDVIVVPDDLPSVQAAINLVNPGGMVLVRSGNYSSQSLNIIKPMLLIGENPATTLLSRKEDCAYVINIISDNVRVSGFTVANNGGCIAENGNWTQIDYNTLKGSIGIQAVGSYNNFSSNTIENSLTGIDLTGSHNTIAENFLSHSGSNGIVLQNSNYNTIENNTVTGGSAGLVLGFEGKDCSYNTVSRNTVQKQTLWGILMAKGSQNSFYKNYIANVQGNHDGYGLALGGNDLVAEKNTFSQNVFMNNTKSVGYNWVLEGTGNSWDSGKRGNFWSDYHGYDNDLDGIGDTPYVIDSKNVDHYPLMSAEAIPEVAPSPSLTPTPSATSTPTSSPTQSTPPPLATSTPTPTHTPTSTASQATSSSENTQTNESTLSPSSTPSLTQTFLPTAEPQQTDETQQTENLQQETNYAAYAIVGVAVAVGAVTAIAVWHVKRKQQP